MPFHWAFAGEVVGGNANDLTSLVADPNVSMHECKAFACQVHAGRLRRPRAEPDEDRRPPGRRATRSPTRRPPPSPKGDSAHDQLEKRSWPRCPRQPTRPAAVWRRCWTASSARSAAGVAPRPRPATGFYTDTTVCIGCKACEVACKQWNQLPADGFHWTGNSYDNTGELSATSWRHVKFIEQFRRPPSVRRQAESPWTSLPGAPPAESRWLMMSDVCKHCVTAPCQQACPTGAIIHNEFENVYIQPDICNGCSYCIAACPFGVITRSQLRRPFAQVHALLRPPAGRPGPGLRQGVPDGVDPVRPDRRAARTRPQARARSFTAGASAGAYLYGDAPTETYSGLNSFYLLVDRPSVYGLPDKPFNPWLHMEGDYVRAVVSGAGRDRRACSLVFLFLGH